MQKMQDSRASWSARLCDECLERLQNIWSLRTRRRVPGLPEKTIQGICIHADTHCAQGRMVYCHVGAGKRPAEIIPRHSSIIKGHLFCDQTWDFEFYGGFYAGVVVFSGGAELLTSYSSGMFSRFAEMKPDQMAVSRCMNSWPAPYCPILIG